MTTFLIDTENVGANWIGHIQLEGDDRLILFVGPTNQGVPYNKLESLFAYSSSNVEFCHSVKGKNAMDFRIAAKVGELISAQTDLKIVSNDTGYDSLIRVLREEGVSISRIPIQMDKLASHESPSEQISKEAPEPQTLKIFVDAFLEKEGISNKKIKEIYDAMEGTDWENPKSIRARLFSALTSVAGKGSASNSARAVRIIKRAKTSLIPLLVAEDTKDTSGEK